MQYAVETSSVKNHLSAILYFLDKWETEFAWTVLPHSLTFEATIFEAMWVGKSFSFLISKALELALMFEVLSFVIAECSDILGNLIFWISSSSSSTVRMLLLRDGRPNSFLFSFEANLFNNVTTTNLVSYCCHSSTFLFLIDLRSYTKSPWLFLSSAGPDKTSS